MPQREERKLAAQRTKAMKTAQAAAGGESANGNAVFGMSMKVRLSFRDASITERK